MSSVRANLRDLVINFYRQPRIAFRALVGSPLMGLVVCSWRGHYQDNVARLLGVCDRCMKPLPREVES